ncbi:hypothetical protein [Lonsdalea iberica]|nr:hypothetical protein [Lonsdalea iberica]
MKAYPDSLLTAFLSATQPHRETVDIDRYLPVSVPQPWPQAT